MLIRCAKEFMGMLVDMTMPIRLLGKIEEKKQLHYFVEVFESKIFKSSTELITSMVAELGSINAMWRYIMAGKCDTVNIPVAAVLLEKWHNKTASKEKLSLFGSEIINITTCKVTVTKPYQEQV
jgi:hypothetical protein